jgi:hypothetical protein
VVVKSVVVVVVVVVYLHSYYTSPLQEFQDKRVEGTFKIPFSLLFNYYIHDVGWNQHYYNYVVVFVYVLYFDDLFTTPCHSDYLMDPWNIYVSVCMYMCMYACIHTRDPVLYKCLF